MTDLVPAISQLGFPIAITSFLLYDYSKKLAAIQIELIKSAQVYNECAKINEKIMERLERIEMRLNESTK